MYYKDGGFGRAIEKYKAEKKLTTEKAQEEVIADACEMMLRDSKAIEALARKNKSLARKIVDWLKDFTKKIKAAFKGIEPYTDAGKIAYQMKNELSDIQKIWDEALVSAVENYNAAEIAPGGDTDVKYSEKEYFTEDKYFKSQINQWDTLTHGAYVKVGEIGEKHPLHEVGMPAGVLRYDVDKLKKNMTDHGDYLTVKLLNVIPEIIAHPIAISQFSAENTVSVFGNVFVGKSPMMIGVTISKDRAGNDISKVRTYNTRRDVGNLITDETVLYLDENKKRTLNWFQACGIQVPLGGTKFGFIRSISQNSKKSNSVGQKLSDRMESDYLTERDILSQKFAEMAETEEEKQLIETYRQNAAHLSEISNSCNKSRNSSSSNCM